MGKKNKNAILKSDENSHAQAEEGSKVEITHERYSGPIPDPKTLEHYNTICSGAADRILKMAEEQAKHRQYIEKIAIGSDAKNSRAGIWAGVSVAFGMMILSGVIALSGNPVEAVSLAGGTITALVGIFIYGTSSRKKEREIKHEISQSGAKRN